MLWDQVLMRKLESELASGPQMGTVNLSVDVITIMPIHRILNINGLQTLHDVPSLEKII